jgi:hypothetical protein
LDASAEMRPEFGLGGHEVKDAHDCISSMAFRVAKAVLCGFVTLWRLWL